MTVLRVSTGAPHARILGLGTYRPRRVVDNAEICRHIESSDEWIRTRSGIVSRRWAGEDETLTEMAVSAAGKALAAAGVEPHQVGCVLVATVSHMSQTPAVATAISHELGATPAAAFDISAGCAGFCYGVSLASDMVRGGSAGHVLVIGVERLSDLTDLTDRSTAFLFGDGAGAVVVGPSSTPGIGPTVWGADGGKRGLIGQSFNWDELRGLIGQTAEAAGSSEPPTASWPALRMAGQEVFRWASYEMAVVAREALDRAGITADQLDAFVPHQANMRITDAMIRALSLPSHVAVARDIAEQGNTSAASIPLAMERMLAAGEAPSGGNALIIGFGAGLTYGAQVVTLP